MNSLYRNATVSRTARFEREISRMVRNAPTVAEQQEILRLAVANGLLADSERPLAYTTR